MTTRLKIVATHKECSRCGQNKPVSEFWRRVERGVGAAGYTPKCIPCMKARKAELHKEDPSKRAARDKRWREENPERRAENARKWRWRMRRELIDFLGGKCVRCGFDDIRALQVDHVSGGGTLERRSDPTAGVNDQKKRVMANPSKYQCLCANCNWIKRHEEQEFAGKMQKEAA